MTTFLASCCCSLFVVVCFFIIFSFCCFLFVFCLYFVFYLWVGFYVFVCFLLVFCLVFCGFLFVCCCLFVLLFCVLFMVVVLMWGWGFLGGFWWFFGWELVLVCWFLLLFGFFVLLFLFFGGVFCCCLGFFWCFFFGGVPTFICWTVFFNVHCGLSCEQVNCPPPHSPPPPFTSAHTISFSHALFSRSHSRSVRRGFRPCPHVRRLTHSGLSGGRGGGGMLLQTVMYQCSHQYGWPLTAREPQMLGHRNFDTNKIPNSM